MLRKIWKKPLQEKLFLLITILSIFYCIWFSLDSCLVMGQWCGQDMDQYVDLSDNLLSGQGFSAKRTANIYFLDPQTNTEYIPEVLRLPGYPFVLTIMRLLYNNPIVALGINILSFFGILYFSKKLITHFLLGWPAIFAYVMISFNALFLFWTAKLGNADLFASAALIGFFYFVFVSLKMNKKKYLFGIAIFGICTLFSRANSLIFILCVMSLASFWLVKNKISYKKQIIFVFLFLMICLGGWLYRNYTLTNRPILTAYTGMNLFAEYIYFTPFQNADSKALVVKHVENKYGLSFISNQRKNGASVPQAITSFSERTLGEVIIYMRQNPKDVFLHFLSAWKSLFIGQTFPWVEQDVFALLLKMQYKLHYTLMFLIPVFPLFFLRKKPIKFDIVFLYVPTLSFLLLTAFAHGVTIGNRGILPVLPICIILGAMYLLYLLPKVRVEKKASSTKQVTKKKM